MRIARIVGEGNAWDYCGGMDLRFWVWGGDGGSYGGCDEVVMDE